MPIGSVLGHGIYAAMAEESAVYISHERAMIMNYFMALNLKFKLKFTLFEVDKTYLR
jgi:hypothetical protein